MDAALLRSLVGDAVGKGERLLVEFGHLLFKSELFDFHIFMDFPVFLVLLISSFIPYTWRRYFV